MKKLTTTLLLLVSLTVYGQVQQNEKPSLIITGSGRVSVKPDLSVLHIYISEQKLKMTDALEALEDKSRYYHKLLRKLDFDEKDIKTTSFGVSKNRVYRDNEYVDNGYIASQSIRLEFPYDQKKLQNILAEFSKNERPVDFSFSFELSEEQRNKTEALIIEDAVKDAREKAEVMAKVSKVTLTGIKRIVYGSSGRYPGPEMMESNQKYAMDLGNAMQSFDFTPGDLIFNDTVSIEWFIE